MADLTTKIGDLTLVNPIMPASGTFGNGAEEYKPFVDYARLGAIISKTVTTQPRKGNPPPRTAETPAGMLNTIGLANPGIDAFLKEDLPGIIAHGVPVIVNIAGETVDEYLELATRLAGVEDVAAIEVNVSCPNVAGGGMAFGVDPDVVKEVTSAVRKVFSRTIIVKLTPNVTSIGKIAGAAESAGADAITCANTYTGMSVDWRTRMSRLSRQVCGLSGPAIKPLSLARVWECASVVKIPIIGCGGIASAEDVLEYAVAGAAAVQVGTMNFVDHRTLSNILDDLPRLLDEAGVEKFADIVGTLK